MSAMRGRSAMRSRSAGSRDRQQADDPARPRPPGRRGGRRSRGWKVWFSNGSMTPARATGVIHRAAQWPRDVGRSPPAVPAPAASTRLETIADERREIAARDLRRRGRWRGTRPAAALRAPSSAIAAMRVGQLRRRLDGRGRRYAASAPAKSCRCCEQRRRSRPATRRPTDRAPSRRRRCVSAASRIALPALDDAELAVQERAVRRCAHRAVVGRARVRPAVAGRGRRPRRLDDLLDVAEAQHVDAPLQTAERRIGRERRLEGRQRLGVALQRRAASARARPAPAA